MQMQDTMHRRFHQHAINLTVRRMEGGELRIHMRDFLEAWLTQELSLKCTMREMYRYALAIGHRLTDRRFLATS